MRLAKGPRPWSVWLFAILFLANASWTLVAGLAAPESALTHWQARFPALPWEGDLTIIALSAGFTIACIPVMLIWFFASRFARWMILIMSFAQLLLLPGLVDQVQEGQTGEIWRLFGLMVTLLAARMLFTPTAAHWINTKGREAIEAFE